MDKRTWRYFKYAGSEIVLLFFLLFMFSCEKEVKKTNILFVMGDQHRGDRINAAGASWLQTPTLNQLAEEGILFTNAYASVPSCLPARTSILTGMSPWQSGQLGYTPIQDFKYEMPKMLAEAGYRTHAVGKNHFTPLSNTHGYQTVELEEAWYTAGRGIHAFQENRRTNPHPDEEKSDYTKWFEEQLPGENLNLSGLHYTDHRGGVSFPYEDKYHATYWTAQRAIDFLTSYDEDKPWLLKVSFQRPHPPFDPPKRWLDNYEGISIPKPNIGKWADEKYGDKRGSLAELKSPTSGNFPMEEIEASRRAYYAAISFVDEQLGRVIKALEERGELENTLIIYTSDHGDMMGDHHMWRKCRPYEGSANIPMIIRWPESLKIDAERGQVRNELVELRDVAPTFLEAANIDKPQVMDGQSMLDILKNRSWREVLDLEHAQIYEKDNAWAALTDGRYKYIYFMLTGQQQLFDLQNDPNEMVDLASSEYIESNELLIKNWREKMIKHFEIRGEEWVKDGELVIQPKSIYFGVNHPQYSASRNNK